MAILVDKKDGKLIYRTSSSTPPDISEQELALKIDERISKEVDRLVSKYANDKRGKLEFYWNLGNVINNLLLDGSVDLREKDLLFLNVRMHLNRYPKVFPKDDIKRKRIIARQFYWLAQFEFETAKNIPWAQWSYIVDNIYLTSMDEFPIWFAEVISKTTHIFSEGFVRLWMEMLNILFKKRKVDLSEWSWEELERPLNATLQILENIKESVDLNDRSKRRLLRVCMSNAMESNRKEYLMFLDKQIGFEPFVHLISDQIVRQFLGKQNS